MKSGQPASADLVTASQAIRRVTDWEAIRREAIAGAPTAALSLAHGVSQRAIQRHAERDSWPTPERLRRRERDEWRRGERRHLGGPQDGSGESAATCTLQPAARIGGLDFTDSQAFESSLAEWMRRLIAESLERIPPPRNLRELATANDIYRKAAGMDTAAKPAVRALFNVAAGAKIRLRQPLVIEADTVGE